MRLKLDLKIFLIIFLFLLTNQIELYSIMMICAVLHEFGHLLAGLLLKLKSEKVEVIPIGVRIVFKLNMRDFNKKIGESNVYEIKKIIVAFAGPLTNFILIYIVSKLDIDIIQKINLVYANFLLVIVNLLPIFPLDGGRILYGVIRLFCGKQKAESVMNIVSILMLFFVTILGIVAFFYNRNIAIFLFLFYIYFLVLKENKKYKNRKIIYKILSKGIEKKYEK